MTTPIQSGPSADPAIHFSQRYPVERTPCGMTEGSMSAASRWRFVTCVQCLAIGAETSPEAATRLAELRTPGGG